MRSLLFVMYIYILSVLVWGISFSVYPPTVDNTMSAMISNFIFQTEIVILILPVVAIPISLVIEIVSCPDENKTITRIILTYMLIIGVFLAFMFMLNQTNELDSYRPMVFSLMLIILLLSAHIKLMSSSSLRSIHLKNIKSF